METEKQKLIVEYIKKVIDDLKNKYNLIFTEEQIEDFINQYQYSEDSIEVIKEKINERVNSFIINVQKQEPNYEELINELNPVNKENCYFGEVYKTYLIHVFKIYEEISNSNLPEAEKRDLFEKQVSAYLGENKAKMLQYLQKQTSSEKLIALAPEELQRGVETLNFDTVGNLYDTFINDVTIVSNDFEGKMYTTVLNDQKIFDEPVFDENGNVRINPNIEYNFNLIKEIYDFAKKHGKEIKFHTFLWHNAVPENLKAEVEKVQDLSLKRKMVLAFLKNYAFHLSAFIKENEYDLRQIEGLNEIASDKPDGELLRDSWWKDTIGNNPQNGDEYYIDVLKIIKDAFPDTEIIYNEYGEFEDYKTDKIVTIINKIKEVEKRDEINLLDGIGLQAHYSDYAANLNRALSPEDIALSALKIQRACEGKNIYITEYDFVDHQKNGSKEKLEIAFMDTYLPIVKGFILWGNSDSLTWYHCVDKDGNNLNAQIIDYSGKPKDIYYQYRDVLYSENVKKK